MLALNPSRQPKEEGAFHTPARKGKTAFFCLLFRSPPKKKPSYHRETKEYSRNISLAQGHCAKKVDFF